MFFKKQYKKAPQLDTEGLGLSGSPGLVHL